MDRVKSDVFLGWARGRGIAVHQRRHLAFEGSWDLTRFWSAPTAARKLAAFAKHVLAGMDPWSTCHLWPAGGRWSVAPPLPTVPGGLAVRAGYDGAIVFSKQDRKALLETLSALAKAAFGSEDDLYIVPDHGRQMVFWSHHDLIHVGFVEKEGAKAFEIHMTEQGYEKEPDDYFTGGKRRVTGM
jgi:hypothetical protein